MNIHRFTRPPDSEWGPRLEKFERAFTYPLGERQWFRISHGGDNTRFYRSMGEAALFVAERDGRILGTLAATVRFITRPNGEYAKVAYLGELKISPDAREGWAFIRLTRAVDSWTRRQAQAGFGIVLAGTRRTPSDYTGRAGMPALRPIGRTAILKIPTANFADAGDENLATTPGAGIARFRTLSIGRYTMTGGDPVMRSHMAPTWLVQRDGSACGRLEDTRRAKRLYQAGNAEILSAHLSCFAYRDPESGAELVRAAAAAAAELGYPSLFLSLPEADAASLHEALGMVPLQQTSATIFGAGLIGGYGWSVNTSEV